MRANEILNLNVMDIATGTMLGPVTGLLIDQETKKVMALAIGGGFLAHPSYVPLDSIKSIKNDVITVPSSSAVVDRGAFKNTGLTNHLSGRNVFTEDGKYLGTIHDYDIDTSNGEIASIIVSIDKESMGGLWRTAGESHVIAREWIRTLGDHVVVDNSVPENLGMNRAA